MPLWFILQFGLEGAVRNGSYEVWHRGNVSGCDVEGQELMGVAKRGELSQEGVDGINRVAITGCPSASGGCGNVRDGGSKAQVRQKAVSRCITR